MADDNGKDQTTTLLNEIKANIVNATAAVDSVTRKLRATTTATHQVENKVNNLSTFAEKIKQINQTAACLKEMVIKLIHDSKG